MTRRRDEQGVPPWLLTTIATVAFALWAAGWIAEFVSNLTGGGFHAPEGALALVMLVVGGSLTADRLISRSRRAAQAVADALRDGEDGTDAP